MKKFLLIIAAIFCCTIGANAQTPDYFCITDCEGAGANVTFNNKIGASATWTKLPELEYSFNGEDWNNVVFGTAIDLSATGKLYVRAGQNGTPGTNGHISESFAAFSLSTMKYISISSTKNIEVSGNIMSLLDGANFNDAIELSDKQCFAGLFYNCTTLIDASALKLPATILTANCYDSMFRGCSNLTAAPVLPAQELASYCYTSLFHSCNKLTSVTAYFLKWPSGSGSAPDYNATNGWFTNVNTKGTFFCSPSLPNTEFGANTIPTTWKRGEIVEPVDEIVFNDVDAHTAIYGKQGKLTYNRTFATEEIGKFVTLYVPFDIEITSEILDKCDILDIYMVSKASDKSGKDVLNVRAMEVGETTEFHTPYIIIPKVTDFTFTQLNTIVHGIPAVQDTLKCSTTKDIYNFVGNYTGEITLETGKGNYILEPTSLEPVSTTKTLSPNRWYMKKVSKKGEQPVGVDLKEMKIVVIGEGGATGIEGVSLTPALSEGEGAMYNLQGQRVSSFNGYRGVVIKGGKKFIVK